MKQVFVRVATSRLFRWAVSTAKSRLIHISWQNFVGKISIHYLMEHYGWKKTVPWLSVSYQLWKFKVIHISLKLRNTRDHSRMGRSICAALTIRRRNKILIDHISTTSSRPRLELSLNSKIMVLQSLNKRLLVVRSGADYLLALNFNFLESLGLNN